MKPLGKVGLPIDKWLFQLLLALRFIPLVQEELQYIIKSVSVRSINLRSLGFKKSISCLLYTSPSPRDGLLSRMPSSA